MRCSQIQSSSNYIHTAFNHERTHLHEKEEYCGSKHQRETHQIKTQGKDRYSCHSVYLQHFMCIDTVHVAALRRAARWIEIEANRGARGKILFEERERVSADTRQGKRTRTKLFDTTPPTRPIGWSSLVCRRVRETIVNSMRRNNRNVLCIGPIRVYGI